MSIRILFACLFFCLTVSASQGDEIDVKNAISIIQKKESGIHSLEWRCNVERVILGEQIEFKSLGKAAVYYDIFGRFRVDKTEIVPWIEGITQFQYQKSLLTFDGGVFRSEIATKAVDNDTFSLSLEDEITIAQGIITQGFDSSNQSVNWRGHPEGIGYVFPYTGAWGDVDVGAPYPLHRLSQMLQEIVKQKREIHIYANNDGVWDIIYHVIKTNTMDVYCRIVYDPGKGRSGTINQIFRAPKQVLNAPDLVPMISYDYQQLEDFYVPTRINILVDVDKAGNPCVFDVYTFSEFKVNRMLSESDFQVDWQKGTNVHDRVAGKLYVVTGDPIDEAEAVRAFKNHGFSTASGLAGNSSYFILQVVFIIIGLLTVSYVAFIYFKKRYAR